MNELTRNIVAYKLIANSENVSILKSLRIKPSKAKDLEDVIHLDRMSIKRRLYKMVAAGLVKEERVKSKKAIAIIYSVVNKPFPKVSLFQILDKIEIDKMTKI